jgi:NADPH:quinone reductase-like Zn-dependent oxidoreductase
MKAIAYRRYGSADVLDLCEHDEPGVDDGYALVRAHAASLNPYLFA